MAWTLIELDLFRTGALIKKSSGEIIKYYIEFANEHYICFIQRKKYKKKWSKPKIIDKSKNRMLLDYSDSDLGLKIDIT
jgi:hypothetical protein